MLAAFWKVLIRVLEDRTLLKNQQRNMSNIFKLILQAHMFSGSCRPLREIVALERPTAEVDISNDIPFGHWDQVEYTLDLVAPRHCLDQAPRRCRKYVGRTAISPE